MSETCYYVAVPFAEKEAAKALGARWDPKRKQWYVTDPGSPVRTRWPAHILALPSTFPGEDRAWGGARLFVDLVPSSCWFTNVRSAVDPADWDALRRHVYRRAGNRCEICGASGRLEAHERWAYDAGRCVQALKRLIALCPNCHAATHFGLAQIRGLKGQALAHLQRVNRWTRAQAVAHVEDAFRIWEEQSRHDWTLDLSLLERAGIRVRAPSACERGALAEERVADAVWD